MLNLIYATRMTQELHKRNEILKIEQIKDYMLTQFQENEPVQEPQAVDHYHKEETNDDFQLPINLETISTENISIKSMKNEPSTASLLASVLSSQPKTDIPMISDLPISGKFLIPEPKNKVQFDLPNSDPKTSELKSGAFNKIPAKRLEKTPPKKLIISKEDLVKMTDKQKPPSPLSRSSSAGEGSMNKGGIFEQRKKMFERSEALLLAQQKTRSSKSPVSSSRNS